MTLVQLKHFIVLAEQGTYAQAAKHLFVSQPALSRSIQALESELGQLLFDRMGKRIALSVFGQWCLPLARQVVGGAAHLKLLGHDASHAEAGEVRLGLSSGPGVLLTEKLLLHMAQNHPQLKVHISRASLDPLMQALRAGDLDMIVVDWRALRPAPDLVIGTPFEFPVDFLCAPDHPILKIKRKLHFEDLRGYPMASTPLSDEAARILTQHFGPGANPENMVTLFCDDIQSLVRVARNSQAILLAIQAVDDALVHLPIHPPLVAAAKYTSVTISGRALPPAMGLVSQYVNETLGALAEI